jgi:hypothetical protein
MSHLAFLLVDGELEFLLQEPSVRQPIRLYASFLQTSPRGIALAFDQYLCSCHHDSNWV